MSKKHTPLRNEDLQKKNKSIDMENNKGKDINKKEVDKDLVEKEEARVSKENKRLDNDDKEKKGFFGKKKDKPDEKLKDKLNEKIKELQDKLTRQMAEFENFRKRTEKEKSSMFSMGEKSTLEKVLPIVDNFERALQTETSDSSFKEGMEKIYKMLIKNLSDLGVTPIEAQGKEFDPKFHNAVMHVDDENYGDNEVVEELQKGYMYKDTVLRHSMVKVAN